MVSSTAVNTRPILSNPSAKYGRAIDSRLLAQANRETGQCVCETCHTEILAFMIILCIMNDDTLFEHAECIYDADVCPRRKVEHIVDDASVEKMLAKCSNSNGFGSYAADHHRLRHIHGTDDAAENFAYADIPAIRSTCFCGFFSGNNFERRRGLDAKQTGSSSK